MKYQNIIRAAACCAAVMLLSTGCGAQKTDTRKTVFGNVAIGGGG